MALIPTFISIIYLINQINSQQGIGCVVRTPCSPGQVRINAIIDKHGRYLGGCNCGCDPSLGDPTSYNYCAEPKTINYNHITREGDCSCNLPAHLNLGSHIHYIQQPNPIQPITPAPIRPITPAPIQPYQPPIQQYQPPINIGVPQNPLPLPPQYYHPTTKLPTYPQYIAPTPRPSTIGNTPSPTLLHSGTPITIVCGKQATCACPQGHLGECNLLCDGASDACKDTLIDCNNNGYACNIQCVAETSCSGSTIINGPMDGPLSINCIGDKSCEGNPRFNAAQGTDFSILCDGMTACKGAAFKFGRGISKVACNGDPDSCIGALFTPLMGIEKMPGAGFSCIGPFCPLHAPEPFLNPAVILGEGYCSEPGNCACKMGDARPCHIECTGMEDACKDGIIECNNDGWDCVVDCIEIDACSGGTIIYGPADASLQVNCIGEKACQGGVVIDGSKGYDLTVTCSGVEACKGGNVYEFGKGIGLVECSGKPDACSGVSMTLLPNAHDIIGASFKCIGTNCPSNPKAFNNIPPPTPPPVNPIPSPQYNSYNQYGQYGQYNQYQYPPQTIQNVQYYSNQYQPQQPVQNPPVTQPQNQWPYSNQYQTPQQPVQNPPVTQPQNQWPYSNQYQTPQQPVQNPPVIQQNPWQYSNGYQTPQPVQNAPQTVPNPQIIQPPQYQQQPAQIIQPAHHCCLTSIPHFKPWNGRCWHRTSESECISEPLSACIWDINNCLSTPPCNSFGVVCARMGAICKENTYCCSEVCRSDGTCR